MSEVRQIPPRVAAACAELRGNESLKMILAFVYSQHCLGGQKLQPLDQNPLPPEYEKGLGDMALWIADLCGLDMTITFTGRPLIPTDQDENDQTTTTEPGGG